MEYISAEEFLKQDEKIQDVFTEWWKAEVGNLYSIDVGYIHGGELGDYRVAVVEESGMLEKFFVCPLLTEGQLRKFIEEKTKYYIIVGFEEIKKHKPNYCFDLIWTGDGNKEPGTYFGNLDCDLLKAYWKVAVQIADEIIKIL